ncbi:hypothetical protein H6F44_14895 [Pseudanabaena sp. FACHB-1277]|uniref:Trypsin-co-occurring domain-containing protein n=1 Tax=Pseudanabaena cinerea FACHB-1277 TaxID=2949581 RepID=A0A926Z727_9CYAN|nr:CU044_2847 family protein [Pseudanabaena cinerea]MBD2151398.1 hypothetical protein [Pseudanabaena cinerea FACHB-1277]
MKPCLNLFPPNSKTERYLSSIEVSEVTLEFEVSLDAKAGVPFIASGGTSSNLKITVKCAFPKQSA